MRSGWRNDDSKPHGPGGTAKLPSVPPPLPAPASPHDSASHPGLHVPDSWDARFSAPAAPKVEVAAPTRPASVHPGLWWLAAAMVLAVTALAGLLAWKLTSETAADPGVKREWEAKAPEVSGEPPPRPSVAARAPRPTSAPSVTAAPSTTVTGSASAEPTRASPADVGACFAGLLPPDAFPTKRPDLRILCTERDAYRTMLRLKSELVRTGGREVTEAMREWSQLGWYETAAFALMRAHCCPDAPPLAVPSVVAGCGMQDVLADLGRAVGTPGQERQAVTRFGDAARCIAAKGYPDLFGRDGPPYGGEVAFFERVLERVRRASTR